MLADPLTKNLNAPVFQRHRDVLLGTSPSSFTALREHTPSTVGGCQD
jgi:hypothetical protein